ncbi:lactonase family protein [Streptomyces sp. CA-111067]|uniref:lactonase family protein n=1 Tax=Streptomyces sp. CA-111067 TaxID=3240046 RepID=UPI003D963238
MTDTERTTGGPTPGERPETPKTPGPPPGLSRRGLLAAAGLGAAGLGATAALAPGQALAADTAARTPAALRPLYIGTYTSDGGGAGLGVAGYDPATGAVTAGSTLAGVPDPSFVTPSADHLYLYAVNEYEGTVTAIAAGQGDPRVLGSQSTGGDGPCHLTVHAAGGHLLSANYDSGSVAVHPIAADGSLGPRTDLVQHTGSGPDGSRQAGPHAHMVLNAPDGAFVLAVDLGTDTVYTYRLDTGTGKLADVSQARMAAGSGPRHGAFHPSGEYLYVANELGDTVTVCGYDQATGMVTPGQSLPTVPAGDPPSGRNYPAEVLVSADGGFAYVSNRGHDSVARFTVGGGGAELQLVDTVPAGGAYPRHIAMDPGGDWLFAANQNSGTVAAFARDQGTGELTATGPLFAFPVPVCVLLL